MKLAIIGGGGFRVPLVYQALLDDPAHRRVTEVALYDVSTHRLAVIESVLAQLRPGYDDAPRVWSTASLDDALEGADFVFCAIRVGGLPGRTTDERVALTHGVLGQETTGPGGIAYGLRTIPVMVHIAERVRTVAPDAFVINFTNPAGMITEALRPILGDRIVGICDTPSGLVRRVAGVLGVDVQGADVQEMDLDYVGLNHLGWLRQLRVGGRDLLPGLLADEAALARLEEGSIFGPDWLRTLGSLPNEYLYYFYFHRDAVRAILGRTSTRGEQLAQQQEAFYQAAGNQPRRALSLWRRTIAEREASYMAEAKSPAEFAAPTAESPESPKSPGSPESPESSGYAPVASAGGYEAVALAVMAAIARDAQATMILNVGNGEAVPGLPADAVVEVSTRVGASGPHALPVAAPDLAQLGLMQQVKAVDRLVIEAATTGSPTAALRAVALHPLVDSVSVARELLRVYANSFDELTRFMPRP